MALITCDCSADLWGDEPAVVSTVVWRKARKEYKCCECQGLIPKGARYEHVTGLWDGSWSRFRTCEVCTRIRAAYCPHGWYYGGLAETLWDCLGFDYRTYPDGAKDDEDEEADADLA